MIEDFFVLGIRNVSKRKIRSWLTMIGIFIGMAAVISMLSLGNGLNNYIDEQFELLGRDKLIIQPKGIFGPPGSQSSVQLTKDDLEVVSKSRGIEKTTYSNIRAAKIEFNDNVRYFFAIGLPLDESEKAISFMSSYDIEQGRELRNGDKFKVVLGKLYTTDEVFLKEVKLRDKILINNQEFEVVGFYESLGNSEDDKNIYIINEVMEDLFDTDVVVDWITAKVSSGLNPDDVRLEVENELRNFRNVKEGKEDFTVQTAEDLLESFGTILTVMQVFLIGIASISLIVGGIGIMNTMYTSVLERTQEIGIMKSVGARNSDIMYIFLIESGILGLTGGLIGVILGIGLAKLVTFIASQAGQSFIQASFSWYLIVGTLAFSFFVGTISGTLPAIQASKLKPVDALRYE